MAKKSRARDTLIHQIPPGLGPYETWIFGPGQQYASSLQKPSRYVTALAELQRPQQTYRKLRRIARQGGANIWLPTLWKGSNEENKKLKKNRTKNDPLVLRFIPFIVAGAAKLAKAADNPGQLRTRLLDGLRQGKLRQLLESVDIEKARFRVGLPVAEAAMKPDLVLEPTSPRWQPDAKLRSRIGAKRITIMAIIDDGLPFAHRNFRDAQGRQTRVEFCWLQSAKASHEQTSVLFGREYTRAQIDDYIARHGDDEDVLYREAGATADTEGLASMINRHATHGAHVMDLAAGYAPERGEEPAEEIRIIGVQLPNVVTMDTSGVGKDMYVLSALHYIFHRADLIAQGYGVECPRLVINFSYGYFGGPHDGKVDIEAAIGELIERRRKIGGPTALILPAGNSFLDRMHASIPDTKFVGGEARIQWRLQPADRTPNYVELWFPPQFDPVGYTAEVHDPKGTKRCTLHLGLPDRIRLLLNDEGRAVGQISVDHHRKDRWRVLIVTAPSEPEHPGSPRIEAGAWTIAIRRTRGAAKLGAEPIRCWIQRDTDPVSLRSGARQSYFEDPDDIRYRPDGALLEEDTQRASIRRFGSLNGLATASVSMAVAGFRLGADLGSSMEDTQPARYSSAGTQDPNRPATKIACSSMSDRSQVLCGTVAAGVRSGARSVMQGTSMAAPFVARRLAIAFVRTSDEEVRRAEPENYLALLRVDELRSRRRSVKNDKKQNRDREDRLGTVLVSPHWQPGIEG